MHKLIYKDSEGNFHFGANAPTGYFESNKGELQRALENLNVKSLWRCTVCNDLHLGNEPPKQCPTCFQNDAYIQIEELEFRGIIELL